MPPEKKKKKKTETPVSIMRKVCLTQYLSWPPTLNTNSAQSQTNKKENSKYLPYHMCEYLSIYICIYIEREREREREIRDNQYIITLLTSENYLIVVINLVKKEERKLTTKPTQP